MAKDLPEASSRKGTWLIWATSKEEPPVPKQNMTGDVPPLSALAAGKGARAARGTARWGDAYLPCKGYQGLEQMGARFPAPPGHTGLQQQVGADSFQQLS